MNSLLRMFDFILLCYATSYLHQYSGAYEQTNSTLMNRVDDIILEREKAISIGKKLISKVLDEEDIYKSISILESGFNDNMENSVKEIEDSISWGSIFTDDKENGIKLIALSNECKDEFVIRLKIIIEELYHEMCKCYDCKYRNEFYSVEMLNDIYFLKEICLEYYTEFGREIILIVTALLHAHFLGSLTIIDDKSNNNLKVIIRIIENYMKELRELIVPNSNTLLVLGGILEQMTCLDLPYEETSIPSISSCFTKSNAISCNEYIRNACANRTIKRQIRPFLLTSIGCRINMKEIYDNLETLKNNWKAGDYLDKECSSISFLYLIGVYFPDTNLLKSYRCSLGCPAMHIRNLSMISINLRLSSQLIYLIPSKFVDYIQKSFCMDYDRLSNISLLSLLKIVDYRRHLLNSDTKTFFKLSKLKPEEALRCIVSVVDCHQAYICHICYESVQTYGMLPYGLKALDEICKIIAKHLENIDSVIFCNDIDNYVLLCFHFGILTMRTLRTQKFNTSSFTDYPHLLEFYEAYHKTGLNIACIYNICFLLGKCCNGIVLGLYSGISSNIADYFFVAAGVFIEHLRSIKYETLSYDKSINDTLEHIMRCLTEIKYGNYKNMLPTNNSLQVKKGWKSNAETNQSNVKHQLNEIEKKFWPKIRLFTDFFDVCEDEICTDSPFRILFEASIISETDISRLFHVFSEFLDLGARVSLGLLQKGVKNREIIKKLEQVLCDMVFNVFQDIENTKATVCNHIRSLNTAKMLYKRLNKFCSTNLNSTVVSKCDVISGIDASEKILIEACDIHSCLEDLETQYYYKVLISQKSFIMGLAGDINMSDIKKTGYSMLLEHCVMHNSNFKKNIKNPDISIIQDFTTQLSITLEAIVDNNNDLLVSSDLLKFVARTISTTHMDIDHELTRIIIKMIYSIECMISSDSRNTLHADTPFRSCSICTMLGFIFLEITILPRTICVDTIEYICSAMAEFYKKINSLDKTEKLEILEYENISDKFLILVDNLTEFNKWGILFHMIYLRTEWVPKYVNIPKVMNVLADITNSITHARNDVEEQFKLKHDLYILVRTFLRQIDANRRHYIHIFDWFYAEICSLSEQYGIPHDQIQAENEMFLRLSDG